MKRLLTLCSVLILCLSAWGRSGEKPLRLLYWNIQNGMWSGQEDNYDAFVFRFIWGDQCEDEWSRFADRNKAVFWKDEFDAAAANSRLAKDWASALDALRAALA